MEVFECKYCKEWKPFLMFSYHSGCKGGRDTSRCLSCKNEMSKAAYHNSPREKKIFNRAKSRATKKGIHFALQVEDIVVPEFCPVFGTPFDNDFSIDRLYPAMGYVPNNINVISMRANVVKGNATLEELEAVVAWMKSKK